MRFYLCLAVTLAFAILLAGCMKAATQPEPSTTAVNAGQAPSPGRVTETVTPAIDTTPASTDAQTPTSASDATETATSPDITAPEEAATPALLGSAGCGMDATPGAAEGTTQSDGVEFSYRLYVPASYRQDTPAPLVLSFHGFGGTAVEQDDYTGLRDTADKYGFILATPQASGSPPEWYLYGPIEDGYVDDFAFTVRLIDDLSDRLCIDPNRIYATGLSNGAGMTSLLGCELDDRLAAIATIAGSPFVADRCTGTRPMPIIAFHGTADPLVPFEEQPDTGRPDIFRFGARNDMRGWAQHNGCDMTLLSQRIASDVVLESYGNCDEGSDVNLYVIEDGGHTWPGATREMPDLGKTTHSINASELIWAFFAAHPRR